MSDSTNIYGALNPEEDSAVFDLETSLGRRNTVACASQGLGLLSLLELCGSTTTPLPVVLPVTATPDVVTAVIRSGALPYILDVDPDLHDIPVHILQKFIEENPNFVLVRQKLLNVPSSTHDSLNEFIKEQNIPSIVIHEDPGASKSKSLGDFDIYNLAGAVGSGALIRSKYEAQISQLREVIAGEFGNQAAMPWQVAKSFKSYRPWGTTKGAERLEELGLRVLPFWNCNLGFCVATNQASIRAGWLSEIGVPAVARYTNVTEYPAIRLRMPETPSYPLVSPLLDSFVLLPNSNYVFQNLSNVARLLTCPLT